MSGPSVVEKSSTNWKNKRGGVFLITEFEKSFPPRPSLHPSGSEGGKPKKKGKKGKKGGGSESIRDEGGWNWVSDRSEYNLAYLISRGPWSIKHPWSL